MSKLDRLITARVASRIILVVVVFAGLIGLTESLDAWRFQFLSKEQGTLFAIMAIVAATGLWSIKVLPVTVLIGSIIALLDLQQNREILILQASGVAIWRILRGPVIMVILGSIFISLFVDSYVTKINRSILPVPRLDTVNIGGPDQVWLTQQSADGRYIISAKRNSNAVHILSNATFFLPLDMEISRIEAETATLIGREWQLTNALLLAPDQQPLRLEEYRVATNSNRADLELRLTSTDNFTFFELRQSLERGLSDPSARAAAAMRYAKLLALPALLVGSLLIAFAFTAGYRRTGSYGGMVLYGIVLGFVVFVTTEMADRAGSAGVLDPTFAAWGPAIVAIVTGLTVLLYKEDGRA